MSYRRKRAPVRTLPVCLTGSGSPHSVVSKFLLFRVSALWGAYQGQDRPLPFGRRLGRLQSVHSGSRLSRDRKAGHRRGCVQHGKADLRRRACGLLRGEAEGCPPPTSLTLGHLPLTGEAIKRGCLAKKSFRQFVQRESKTVIPSQ